MIHIFTDGASRGNPGPGGWGAVIVYKKQEIIELGGGERNTTNNRMELSAVYEALAHIQTNISLKQEPITVFTDSKYVVHGITRWIEGWKQNGWKTKGKTDVSNRDLWENLDGAQDGLTITWKLLPGHSGVVGNERADTIATSYADDANPGLYHGSIDEYPLDILDISIDTEVAEKRKEKRERSNAKAYSYLSLVDGEICRHTDWESTKKRVHGKKAQFRKALSLEDEKKIVEGWGYSFKDINDCS